MTKNILGFSIWIYVFGFSQCNGLVKLLTETLDEIYTINSSKNYRCLMWINTKTYKCFKGIYDLTLDKFALESLKY